MAPLFPTPTLSRSIAALGVARRLRLGRYPPQMRAADGVGDHQAQSDAGMPEQGGTDGGVTVQVEIGLHRRCYLRARQFRGFRAVAARGAAGFLGGEIDRKSTRLNSSH